MSKNGKLDIISGNALKILAAAAMTADHVGLMFFPQVQLLRIIGRLAFPVFAYMIAEGCRYTRSRLRYFLQLFGLAVLCQIVYFVADGSMYLSVLVTFSCSIIMIYALQEMKKDLFRPQGPKLRGMFLFFGAVGGVWLLNRWLTIDYGFWGCMVPVFTALFQQPRGESGPLSRLDQKWIHILSTGIGLLLLALDLAGNQIWSMAALIPLALYSGRRGKGNMKYFFYLFYPLHLALLQVIAWFVW